MRNTEVLARIDNPAFVQELGRFNLEINIPPQTLTGDGAAQYERQVREQLNAAEARAQAEAAGMVMIGILPTLRPEHLTSEAISSNPRYALLEEQLLLARGEDIHIDIRGAVEGLETWADSIAPEAACTSVQFHLQVSPGSPRRGTPHSPLPPRRLRSAPIRRTSSATSSGARRGSPCSPRPRTHAQWR